MSIKKIIPNTITSLNLLSGVLGVIFTLKGHIDIAFPLMLAAAVFDFCDGLAARALDAYSDMGKELDSLSDMVSFGVLPSVMLYAISPEGSWTAFIPLFIAVMSGLRLAKFNIDERQSEGFIGLATPACAMICGSLAYFIAAEPGSVVATWAGGGIFIPVVSVCLGLLLVCPLPMFSMKFKKGQKQEHSLLIKRTAFLSVAALSVIVVAVLRTNWSAAVTLIFLSYIFVNCIFAVFKM